MSILLPRFLSFYRRCYNVPLLAATYTAIFRTAAIIDWRGNVDTSTIFQMGASEYFRGIASVDGSGFYLAGSAGMKYAPYGSQYTSAVVLSSGTAALRAAGIYNGALYAATSTSPYGIVKWFNAPLPTTTQSVTQAAGLMTGTEGLGSYTTAFHFDDEGALYVVGYYYSTTGALSKYVWNAATSTWTTAAGYPKGQDVFAYTSTTGVAVSPYGLKGITGYRRPSDNKYILYLVRAIQPTTHTLVVVSASDTRL